MAIDDNTSYELTGAQVKDLANKIKAKAADNIFVGATSAAPGSKGLVPAPQAADDTKFLSGDGTWKTVSGGTSATIVYCTYASNKINTWSDSTHTTPITAEEIHAASQSGPVVLLWEESSTTTSYTTNTKESWNVVKAYKSESTPQGGSTTYSYSLLVFQSHIPTWMYRLRASSGSTNQYSRSQVSLQEELSAGSGIEIDSGVISATGGGVIYYIEANGNTYNPWTETLDPTTDFYIYDEDGMRVDVEDVYEAAAASSVLLVGTQTGDKPSTRDDAISIATIVSANYNSDAQEYEFIVLLQLVDFSDGSTKDLVVRKIVSGGSFFNTVSEESIGGGTTYTAGTNIQISAQNVISAIDTTYSAFTGATSQQAGAAGLVPAPTTSDPDKFLKGDGTWATPSGGGSSATKFYSSHYSDNSNVTFYKNSALTTAATYQEIIDALQGGGMQWVQVDNGVEYVLNINSYVVDENYSVTETRISIEFDDLGSYYIINLNRIVSNLSSAALFSSWVNKYTLPTASANTLGGIKVGNNLSISSGVLSASDALIIREWS